MDGNTQNTPTHLDLPALQIVQVIADVLHRLRRPRCQRTVLHAGQPSKDGQSLTHLLSNVLVSLPHSHLALLAIKLAHDPHQRPPSAPLARARGAHGLRVRVQTLVPLELGVPKGDDVPGENVRHAALHRVARLCVHHVAPFAVVVASRAGIRRPRHLRQHRAHEPGVRAVPHERPLRFLEQRRRGVDNAHPCLAPDRHQLVRRQLGLLIHAPSARARACTGSGDRK